MSLPKQALFEIAQVAGEMLGAASAMRQIGVDRTDPAMPVSVALEKWGLRLTTALAKREVIVVDTTHFGEG